MIGTLSSTAEPNTQPSPIQNHHIVAVIPAYNEARYIASTVLKLRRYPITVLVVDDGSQDDTADLALAAGARVIRQLANNGKAAALQVGLKAAQALNPDVVVVIDADGQHIPEELPRLVQPILTKQVDIVIGSRYLGDASAVPRHRVLGHRFFNWLTGMASGQPATDSQSGFRAFSLNALPYLEFQTRGFGVESEMQFIAHQYNLRLYEVPITVRYPDPPRRSVWAHGLGVLNGLLRLVGQYRPLLFFSVPGAVVLLVGLGFGLLVVEIYRQTQQLALGYAMLSLLLVISGIVAFSTGFTLHSIRALLLEFRRDSHGPLNVAGDKKKKPFDAD